MNKIIIGNNLDLHLSELLQEIKTSNYKIFEEDDFKVENAHKLISHAYIASEEKKYLIAKFKTINKVSQNSLLKLLEEPPPNIIIIFIAPSKSIFLPTIKSRMIFDIKKDEYEKTTIDFNFDRLDVKTIFNFLKDIRKFSHDELRIFIYEAFKYYQKKGYNNENELELFDRVFRLNSLNSSQNHIILEVLLMLLLKAKS